MLVVEKYLSIVLLLSVNGKDLTCNAAVEGKMRVSVVDKA